MLNGRTLAGLTAYAAEHELVASGADPSLQIARISVDMFRAVPLVALNVAVVPVRQGRRVRVVDVTITDRDGGVQCRGSVVALRRTDDEEALGGEPWDAPRPEDLPAPTSRRPPWEVRSVSHARSGGVGSSGFGTACWVREYFALVEGEETSPIVRATMAADLTNAIANAAGDRIGYINADLQVHLTRAPVDDWVGLERSGAEAHRGVAFSTADLYDRVGRIGHVSLSSVADGRISDA